MGGIVRWHTGRVYFFTENTSVYCYREKPRYYPNGLSHAMNILKDIKRIGPESFTKWTD